MHDFTESKMKEVLRREIFLPVSRSVCGCSRHTSNYDQPSISAWLMMATKTSLAYGCCTPTMRRMRAGYEDDYLFHDSADSPIYDARPTLPQTMEESSDQILDKLELAGRVPSKEKFRRMACNVSFIFLAAVYAIDSHSYHL